MIILIDAGNTRIKFGWLEPHTGGREPRALALRHTELPRLTEWLQQLPARAVRAVGVNVAGPAMACAIETMLAPYSCAVTWITSQATAAGILNRYDPVSQLGADRWASLAGMADAAGAQRTRPLMLATFGTATTIDTLVPNAGAAPDSGIEWVFEGGIIFPGPALMGSSLANGTANLPVACANTAPHPTHTHQAIATGIAAAQAGAVLRQWLAGIDRFGCPPQVFSAGGAWPDVQHETQRLLADMQSRLGFAASPVRWLATPVFDGLVRLAGQLP
jgi:type III pantothenate kinase